MQKRLWAFESPMQGSRVIISKGTRGKTFLRRTRLKKEMRVPKLQTHVQENAELNRSLPIPRPFFSLPHCKHGKPGAERRLQYPLVSDAKCSICFSPKLSSFQHRVDHSLHAQLLSEQMNE